MKRFTAFCFLFIVMSGFLPVSAGPGGVTTLDWVITLEPEHQLRITPEQSAGIHPLVQRVLMVSDERFESGFEKFHSGETPPHIDLVIYSDAGINAMPGRAVKAAEGVYAVRTPKRELESFAGSGNFRWIEPALLHEPTMNRTRGESGADIMHSGLVGGTSYTGEDVMVVIFDTGIDFTHASFRRGEDLSESRIAYIWDQTLPMQPGDPTGEPPFDYGSMYTREHIEAYLAGGPPLRTKDSTGHGTHVADIAAGSGSQFRGMAPDADIVVIKGGDQSFSTFDIILAIEFMKHLNREKQRPVVGNFSIGGYFTSRDGMEPTELAMDQASQIPGVVMVTSAGNSGAQDRFVQGRAGQDPIRFTVPDYAPNPGTMNDVLLFDIWLESDTEAVLEVEAPSGYVLTVEPGMFTTADDSTQGVIRVENNISENNGDRRIIVQIADVVEAFPPASGNWELRLTGTDEDFKAWTVQNRVGSELIVPDAATNDFSVTTPGSGRTVITAGAYVVQDNWINAFEDLRVIPTEPIESLALFSSLGPTRDGRVKPEITAPGQAIGAAFSIDGGYAVRLATPGREHIYLSGTSMASPAVAGAVALLLQAKPDASAAQIKEALKNGARTDTFTGAAENNNWGSGKLDVPGALYYLKARPGDAAWTPELISVRGALNEPGAHSFKPGTSDGFVYRLPSRFGIPVGMTLYTGYLEGHEESDAYLEIKLVELDGDRILNQKGDMITVPVSELRQLYEVYFDLYEFGVIVNERTEAGIQVRLRPGSGELPLIEFLGRSLAAGTPNPLSLYDAESGRLSAWSGGRTLYMDVAFSRFNGTVEDVPPGFSLPFEIVLGNNYPNPFNDRTIIPFELDNPTNVTLEVYDITGRRVAVLEQGRFEAGRHEHQFDATGLASGVYFYRLRTTDQSLTQKMLLLK